MWSTTRAVAEPLGHAVHVDGEFVGHGFTDRIARPPVGRDAASPPSLGSKTHLDHEHQFAAALPAVDDRRRVLRLRRDEAHLAGERLARRHRRTRRTLSPGWIVPTRGFRHEGAHLDVRRRQQRRRPARPAATHSPSRYSVSKTSPACGALCRFCERSHSAFASAASRARTSASAAVI